MENIFGLKVQLLSASPKHQIPTFPPLSRSLSTRLLDNTLQHEIAVRITTKPTLLHPLCARHTKLNRPKSVTTTSHRRRKFLSNCREIAMSNSVLNPRRCSCQLTLVQHLLHTLEIASYNIFRPSEETISFQASSMLAQMFAALNRHGYPTQPSDISRIPPAGGKEHGITLL